jgi:uncharacterized protein GlcG (DUF336 family)
MAPRRLIERRRAMRTKPTLEHTDALAIAERCRAAAAERDARVSVAVVDEAGALVAFERLDGARAYSVDLAIRKARTAAAIGVPTRVLEAMAKAGQLQGSPEVLALAGGLPVMADGVCAGAVGVSGSTGETDDAIARAGAGAG